MCVCVFFRLSVFSVVVFLSLCVFVHPRLISALALSRPTLHMEDFRRKAGQSSDIRGSSWIFIRVEIRKDCQKRPLQVQQRYRSIEAIFRESFEHLENEDASTLAQHYLQTTAVAADLGRS